MIARVVLVMVATVLISACGGGGGSSSSATTPVATASIQLSDSRGLVSGGVGLVDGQGVVGVGLVGVSGTGLSVGVSGSGLSLGTIQGFGSIILNDVAIDTTSSVIEVSGMTAQQSDLRQGQQVLIVQNENGEAVHVSYRPNVVGPIEQITVRDEFLELGSAEVLGQVLLFNAATVYENTDLLNLVLGQVVEISGILAGDGSITVTFVRPLVSATAYTLIGEATGISTDQFSIGSQLISFDAANLRDFEDGILEERDVVEVTFQAASYAANLPALEADGVQLLQRLIIDEDVILDAEGIIDSFVSINEFTVQNQAVALDGSVQFFGGSADDLELGERVLARGTVNSVGALLAQEIYFETDDTALVEGPVTSLDLQLETITVLGVTFKVRDLTDFDGFDGLDELLIGDQIEIAGYLDAGSPIAADIEREDPSETGAELRGPVGNFDGITGELQIFGIDLSSSQIDTSFEGFENESLTQAEFFNALTVGVFVSATWDTFTATTDVPDELSLEDD